MRHILLKIYKGKSLSFLQKKVKVNIIPMSSSEKQPSGQQLTLPFPETINFGVDNFHVSSSNEQAFAFIMSWPQWPSPQGVLVGPKGGGKTHLLKIWQEKTEGIFLKKKDIRDFFLKNAYRKQKRPVALDDIDHPPFNDAEFFHFLNTFQQQQIPLLMTSTCVPGHLNVALPDLRSRLRGLTTVTLQTPDDVLLRFVLLKLFSDRQLKVDPTVITCLLQRMPRCLHTLRNVIAALDRESLTCNTPLSRVMVLRYLSKWEKKVYNHSQNSL